MEALKIALVCDWFLPQIGGVEHQIRDLALGLTAYGAPARTTGLRARATEMAGRFDWDRAAAETAKVLVDVAAQVRR